MPIAAFSRDDIEDLFGKDEDQVLYWLTTEECILSECDSPRFAVINLQRQIYWFPTRWSECEKCGQIALGKRCDCYSPNTLSDRILTAFTAARQARFEHGESHH